MERYMTITLKKFALAAITLGGLSLATLGVTSAPAAARTVCDWDGDDCRHVPDYYNRYYDRDWRHDWRERRDWERREAWRHRYYDRYYDRRYYGGPSGSLYFNF